jgi:NTE family protein
VLKVLEREHIPIDVVAGSSIGAMVGGLWASGRSAEELEQLALRFKNPWDVRALFMFDLALPWFSLVFGLCAGGLVGWLAGVWTGLLFGLVVCVSVAVALGPLAGGPIQGARLMERLEQDFAGKTFADTWLPLKVVAANPMAREEIVFESGSLVDAVRASVSIPGIFKPVRYKGNVCLDGGVVNPVPVSVLKRAGVNRVIAINVFPTTPEFMAHRQTMHQRRAERDAQLAMRPLVMRLLYRLRQELVRSVSPLVFDVIMRSMQFMEYQISEVACREADITLRPTVPGSHWLEFFNPEKFIRRGEEVALEHLPELKRIAGVRSVDKG